MLTLLRVANYALIDEIEVEFDAGLSVMTGETGAGKSILIDAVALALGDRADASAVRAGARRAEISLVFECPADHPALVWLRERELDDETACTIRRLIAAEGRSRAFINNQPVTLQDLRSLGATLIDIHGQHAHQSLLSSAVQRQLLDSSSGSDSLASDVASAWREWQRAEAELAARTDGIADREAKLDLLTFQLNELRELSLAPGEIEQLRIERSRLANVDRMLAAVGEAVQRIFETEGSSAYEQVAAASRSVEAAARHDTGLAALAERLAAIEIELKEAAGDLSRYRDELEADPERLDHVADRLDKAQRLARRHRVEEAALGDVEQSLVAQIEELESGTQSVETLAENVRQTRKAYFDKAERLSAARATGAEQLSDRVTGQLRELGMPHAEFRAAIDRRAEERADSNGIDDVEFLVQINPGQPFAPLSKAASGGELSRVSLALEVVTTGPLPIPTYIFDEVDAGIGGGVAEIVGRRLREIAREKQVLCVTHLPQVASQGTAHYRIVKLTDGKTSRTQIRHLARDERIEELARMLGGISITAATRAHATEMIENSEAAGGSTGTGR